MKRQLSQLGLALALALGLSLAALFLLDLPARALTRCVGGGGLCYSTIQEAVDQAGNGDTIQVMAGTYNENVIIEGKTLILEGGYSTDFSSRTPRTSFVNGGGLASVISITANANVTLDGFTIYNGDGSANIFNNVDAGGGGIAIWDSTAIISNNLIENNVGSSDINYSGMGGGVYVINSTSPVLIQNNTIRANTAFSVTAGSVDHHGMGGAIGLNVGSEVIIRQNEIVLNTATRAGGLPARAFGGGIFAGRSELLVVEGNILTGNLGLEEGNLGLGGGMLIHATPLVTVANNVIAQNTALISGTDVTGGGIFLALGSMPNSRVTVSGNWIMTNTAAVTMAGNTIQGSGGGLSVNTDDASNQVVLIRDNHLVANKVAQQVIGTDGFVSGGGLSVNNLNSPLIQNNHMIANKVVEQLTVGAGGGAAGGGLTLNNVTNALIQGNEFIENAVAGQSNRDTRASALSINGSTAALQDNLIRANVTDVSGDEGDSTSFNQSTVEMTRNRILNNQGLGLFAYKSTVTSTNDVLAGNQAGGVESHADAVIHLINATLYGNERGAAAFVNGTILVTNSIIYSNTNEGLLADPEGENPVVVGTYNLLSNTINYSGGAVGNPATDITGQDPLFRDPANDDFHLQAGSPAIDSGTGLGAPPFDFDQEQRPWGLAVDIGADEFVGIGVYLPAIRKSSP